jgi:hypothetical protein
MLVTPAQAEKWLKECNTHNRSLNDKKVLRFADFIKSGFWKHTHQGIAFSENNILIDGQHRLAAVVKANMPAIFDVTFGLPFDVQAVIDTEGGRTPTECLKLGMGMDVDKECVAIARAMIAPVSQSRVQIQDLAAFIKKYYEPIKWTDSIFPTHIKQVTTAALFATVARASLTEDRSRLIEFANCVMTGVVMNPKDDIAAIRLVRALGTLRTNGNQNRGDAYRYSQRAVRAFLDRQYIDKLYKAASELFPLPDDVSAQAQAA